jgi:hypothetical protein
MQCGLVGNTKGWYFYYARRVSKPLSSIKRKNIIMSIKLIFTLVFTAQILGLSFFLPRFLLFKIAKVRKNTLRTNSIIKRYKLLNTINIVIGFLVLALLLFHPDFSLVELQLLTIGIYFLLQVSPVIINKQLLENSEMQ